MTDTATAPATDTANLPQCPYKNERGRQCKLSAGHDAKGANNGHKFVLRGAIQPPKPLAELRKTDESLKGFSLSMETVPKGESVSREQNREAAPRDADQQRVDKDAVKAYEAWVAAGKPKGFDKSGDALKRYIVPPAAFDTVVAMLRRATTGGGPLRGKRVEYRRRTHTSGNVIINFRFSDQTPGTNA